MSADRHHTPFEQRLAKRWLRNFLRKKLRLDVPQEMINLIASFNTWGWNFEAAQNGPYAIDPSTPEMGVLCENTTIENALSNNWFLSSSFHFEKGFKYKFTIRNHKKTENEWVYGMKRVTDAAAYPGNVHYCHGGELLEIENDCTGDEIDDDAWQLFVAGTESGTRFEIEGGEICGAGESFEDDDVAMQ